MHPAAPPAPRTPAPAPATRRGRLAPVLLLLVLAPWVGEYLLGNVEVRLLPALVVLVPLYGGGALLVRELVRRTGRGWPAVLLLGGAYGVVEAGLVDTTLFDPSFAGTGSVDAATAATAGYRANEALTYLAGHAVWSIAVPIAVVELLLPARRREPWLGRTGLALTTGLYLLGCWVIRSDSVEGTGFVPSPGQVAAVLAVAAVLVAAALAVPRPRRDRGAGPVPRPLPLGAGGFVLLGAYCARPESALGAVLGVAALALAGTLLLRWARRAAWSPVHEAAVVSAALLTYAWLGFVLTLLLAPGDGVRYAGNAAFAALAAALCALLVHRARREVPPHP